jgi:hypothetical protein
VKFIRSQIALVMKDLVHHLANGGAPAKPRPISVATSMYIFTARGGTRIFSEGDEFFFFFLETDLHKYKSI